MQSYKNSCTLPSLLVNFVRKRLRFLTIKERRAAASPLLMIEWVL